MLQVMQNQSALTMSSREISTLLNSRHHDVCRSIDRLSEKQAISGYAPTPYTSDQNGQIYYEYHISKRDSYVIVAQLSPEFTAALVDRWQELESNTPAIPKSFAEALRLAADQQEVIQAQAAQIEHQKPAVEFVERYVESTGNLGFRQVCKLLKAKENDFRAFLQDNRIMYRLGSEWTPYACHIVLGRFHVSTGTSESEHAYSTAKFTPKGVKWVSELWIKETENA